MLGGQAACDQLLQKLIKGLWFWVHSSTHIQSFIFQQNNTIDMGGSIQGHIRTTSEFTLDASFNEYRCSITLKEPVKPFNIPAELSYTDKPPFGLMEVSGTVGGAAISLVMNSDEVVIQGELDGKDPVQAVSGEARWFND
ncbi:hypothetical protein D9613_012245 [Agrocybe pediades]|uniref:Uncharacterized protein n=1 Tax=Agrocybe pediades TaxID=84607 RepID=A0A8H4QEL7_9AGAR|nr:hypothetical protein D9613_012245 [Agrocybe pediades]